MRRSRWFLLFVLLALASVLIAVFWPRTREEVQRKGGRRSRRACGTPPDQVAADA